jgi:hypothetical protein
MKINMHSWLPRGAWKQVGALGGFSNEFARGETDVLKDMHGCCNGLCFLYSGSSVEAVIVRGCMPFHWHNLLMLRLGDFIEDDDGTYMDMGGEEEYWEGVEDGDGGKKRKDGGKGTGKQTS